MEMWGHVHHVHYAMCVVVLNWKLRCPLAINRPSEILNIHVVKICIVMKMNKLRSMDISFKHPIEPKND